MTIPEELIYLGRRVEFDERSRSFPIRELRDLDPQAPRSYTWRCGVVLNQESETEPGGCVGHAWAHEHGARPVERVEEATSELAFSLYREAKRLDAWPGEDYPGTSVIAGAKAMQARGLLVEYRWAFSLQDALWWISRRGPAVLGINWYEAMFAPDEHGYVEPAGGVAGGHAILARGVSARARSVLLHNSWGAGWGRNGTCLVSWDTLERLLSESGECCAPVVRRRKE